MLINADSGFDYENIRDMPEQKKMIGSIKDAPRNGETKHEKYFNQKFYKEDLK